ncbi:MAG TPA: Ig-like domain-containing protein [Terriglobia bacterium]|nr:Ig-like domain-containing protein [Terriglobia bacterium]
MKQHTNFILMAIGLGALCCPVGGAATLWEGPTLTFVNNPGSDPAQATNQDRLTPDVWITRASSEGIYNAATETSFTHFFSPQNTAWSDGALTNYASLTYVDWDTWSKTQHGGPPGTIGIPAVVHLVSEDIYLSITFSSWGGFGGGFSYVRSTPVGEDQPPVVTIDSPTNGASFTAPATISINATASDPDGSVTNVEFFDAGALLAETNNTPYSVTAIFAAGPHALTAVATDNAGLSTTSSIVNVLVSAVNNPVRVSLTNPPANSVFGNTDAIGISALVADSSGTITNVEFFDGDVLLQSLSAPPYSFSTGPFTFPLGSHILTAVALDDLGATGTSAPVRMTIARYTPELTNGAFSLFLFPVATNLSAPLYGISPPGDIHRLFVLEQKGLVRIIQDGTLLPEPALDIQNRVQPPLNANNANDERGLLGLAFHPGFSNPSSPGYQTLYTYNSEMIPVGVSPTYPCPNDATNNYMNVVNEWKISSTNANVIDPASRRAVISFGKNAGNHNGGTITFGPDGYAYLALGDGGNANDFGPSHIEPTGNAQNLSTPLGKMLRFDPLNPALNPSSADPISLNGQYRIPATNPFQAQGQVPEIYAYGLRNPYRFCFDPVTGDLIEGDVGQNNIEEVNRIILGGNYGWAIKEGDFLFNHTNSPSGQPAGTIGPPPGNFSPGDPGALIDPISGPMGILEYDHNNGISITGGFVYRGTAMPELYGKYIFGDLALIPRPVRINGRLFYADLQTGQMNVFTLPQFGSEILPNGQTVHGFGQDANGELYAMATDTPPNGNGGVVYKLLSFRLAARLAGNQLDLSWPIAGVRLQAQTDSPGVGVTTNWLDVPGSTATNHVVVPVNLGNGSAFYRLVSP